MQPPDRIEAGAAPGHAGPCPQTRIGRETRAVPDARRLLDTTLRGEPVARAVRRFDGDRMPRGDRALPASAAVVGRADGRDPIPAAVATVPRAAAD